MAYNNGGGYRNNRGGNNGNQRSSYGGKPSNYLRSSSFTKTIIYEGPDGTQGEKEKVSLEPGLTEEIAVAFTADKAQEFVDRLVAAINDPQGDGGIRMTMYCQHRTNQDTGEEFDGASIMLVGKFPPKNNNRGGGSFSRGGGNRGGGNGRRDYPAQGNRGGSSSQGQQGGREAQRGANRPTNNGYNGPGNRPSNSQGNGQHHQGANSDTHHNGQTTSDQSMEATHGDRDGNTQDATNTAYPSDTGYSQEPGW